MYHYLLAEHTHQQLKVHFHPYPSFQHGGAQDLVCANVLDVLTAGLRHLVGGIYGDNTDRKRTDELGQVRISKELI